VIAEQGTLFANVTIDRLDRAFFARDGDASTRLSTRGVDLCCSSKWETNYRSRQ